MNRSPSEVKLQRSKPIIAEPKSGADSQKFDMVLGITKSEITTTARLRFRWRAVQWIAIDDCQRLSCSTRRAINEEVQGWMREGNSFVRVHKVPPQN